MGTDRQGDRQGLTDRKRQTDRQEDRQTDRQLYNLKSLKNKGIAYNSEANCFHLME